MDEYNKRCQPPWSEAELEHKLADAVKKAEAEPERVGHLADGREDGEGRSSVRDRLVQIARNCCHLFHDADDRPFAAVHGKVGTETMAVESHRFRRWLGGMYYGEGGVGATDKALREACETVAAVAIFDGPEEPVYTRLAGADGAVYLDLANAGWQVVQNTDKGWQVLDNPPVHFRRRAGMLALPVPERGGDVRLLRDLLNLSDNEPLFILLLAWLMMCLRPHGPYPILCLHGEQGCGKSTMARLARNLVDPGKAGLRRLPRDERDLFMSAQNSRVLTYDNLGRLEPWMSDALCSLSTGGGYGTRRLYTDDEEQTFDECRPIALTGINEVATRGDLASRAIIVQLPRIPTDKRQDEESLLEAYEQIRPGMLGCLLDGVSLALRDYRNVQQQWPRMADFARWAAAAMPAFGYTAEEFARAYAADQEEAASLILDDSPVPAALRRLLKSGGRWPKEGTTAGAAELLAALATLTSQEARRTGGWPSSPNDLGRLLRRIAPALRAEGIDIVRWPQETKGRRLRPITITITEGVGS
jgi:hypothetical protein